MKLIICDLAGDELPEKISTKSACSLFCCHWSMKVQMPIAAASMTADAMAIGALTRPAIRIRFAPDAAVPEPSEKTL